jgi:hypothetical protein
MKNKVLTGGSGGNRENRTTVSLTEDQVVEIYDAVYGARQDLKKHRPTNSAIKSRIKTLTMLEGFFLRKMKTFPLGPLCCLCCLLLKSFLRPA